MKNIRKILIFALLSALLILAVTAILNSQSKAQPNRVAAALPQAVWDKVIRDVFKLAKCAPYKGPRYGSLYYNGPLIDSHYHIPSIPDDPLSKEKPKVNPVLGRNLKIADINCTLQQEKTKKVFAFFPVYPEIYKHQLKVVYKTMKRYPKRFVPFIMPPDDDGSPTGSPTVNAKTLEKMLKVYPKLFKGYGEIGLYGRDDGAGALPPDSKRLMNIYPVIRKHKLAVYFHLGEGDDDNLARVLKKYPDIKFIFHGDQLISYENGVQNLSVIENLISKYPNLYYTVDELYGDDFLLKPSVTKAQFLAHLDNYETLLKEDLTTWKGIIERHPDQFMWGTDRSDQVVWSHHTDVGQALANYGRAFIAQLDQNVQERFAYKNAERLLLND